MKGSAGLKAFINYAPADENAIRFCTFVWEEKKFPAVCLFPKGEISRSQAEVSLPVPVRILVTEDRTMNKTN